MMLPIDVALGWRVHDPSTNQDNRCAVPGFTGLESCPPRFSGDTFFDEPTGLGMLGSTGLLNQFRNTDFFFSHFTSAFQRLQEKVPSEVTLRDAP